MLNEMMYARPAPRPDMASLIPHESIVQINNDQLVCIGSVTPVLGGGNRTYFIELLDPKSKEILLVAKFYYDGSMVSSTAFLLGLGASPSIDKIMKVKHFKSFHDVKAGNVVVLRNGTAIRFAKVKQHAMNPNRFWVYAEEDDEDDEDEAAVIFSGAYELDGVCVTGVGEPSCISYLDAVGIIQ